MRRQNYCRLLDQQNIDKSKYVRLKTEQETMINKTTHTSLESDHHTWGRECTTDKGRERAIFGELVATVNYRKQREHEGRESEKRDAAHKHEETEKKMAWQWHVRREECKQEKKEWAAMWSEAAETKRKAEKARKAAELQEEKEQIQRVNMGMIPARRVRRPKEECIATQEVLPPQSHTLTPLRMSGPWQS
jgi:hypothetical protein